MKQTGQKAQWQELSEQVFEEVVKWRETNPHATMREIEKALDERIFELRAKMLADTAEGSGEVRREAVKCPDCGGQMMRKGKKKRTLLQREGQELELEREYLVCLECGRGLFPPG
jgi:YgiT-type zinc finger domain-containing protein